MLQVKLDEAGRKLAAAEEGGKAAGLVAEQLEAATEKLSAADLATRKLSKQMPVAAEAVDTLTVHKELPESMSTRTQQQQLRAAATGLDSEVATQLQVGACLTWLIW